MASSSGTGHDAAELLSRDVLARLCERFERGQRALDPAIALRLIAQAALALNDGPQLVSYQVNRAIRPASGYCTNACDYDLEGVCQKCGCFDPGRFVLLDFPSEAEDSERQMFAPLLAAGLEVRRAR